MLFGRNVCRGLHSIEDGPNRQLTSGREWQSEPGSEFSGR